MPATQFIRARLTLDMKRRVTAAVEHEGVSESVWLKRLIIQALLVADHGGADAASKLDAAEQRDSSCHSPERKRRRPCDRRVYVRLRPEDMLLLEVRAEARGMRSATYVSVLTRSHLRCVAPLPKDELLALRRSIGELAAIGRNVNQIAKYAHGGGRLPPSLQHECLAMLKVCEAMRTNTTALLVANLRSWECLRNA
ncbi:MAG: plasmid mobilization relaxosome protein MobC [Gammaproteobacteria bacterium]